MVTGQLAAWEGFFTYVGLVAGGLTGLIFIALSLQIAEVRARPPYVARARTTLGALAGTVVLCGFALIPGQTVGAFAVECLLLFVAMIADVIRTLRSFGEPGSRLERPLLVRTGFALVLLSLGTIGSIGLLAAAPWAMPAIGVSALLGLPVRLIQAWALLVAALPSRPDAEAPAAGRAALAGDSAADGS
jgi:hypothetical protein